MADQSIGRGVIEIVADARQLRAQLETAKKSIDSLARSQRDGSARAQKGVESYIATLKLQNAQFGKSAREQELMNLAFRGASTNQLKAADAALQVAEANKAAAAQARSIGEANKASVTQVVALGNANKAAAVHAATLANAQKRVSEGIKTAALGTLGLTAGIAALAGREIVSLTDAYIKYSSQLKLVSAGEGQLAQNLDNIRRIAAESQRDIGQVGTLYVRVANAVDRLGLSSKSVSDVVETVALSLKVSGATATESASAMLQFSQAIASGVLRGQEFNAVNEAAPRLMVAIAEAAGVTVGELRELAFSGGLASDVLVEIVKSLPELRNEASQVQTIGGAFTLLRNELILFLGKNAEASGSVQLLTSVLKGLAENLNLITAAALGYGTLKLAQFFTKTAQAALEKRRALAAAEAATKAEQAATIAATAAEANRAQAIAASGAVEAAAEVKRAEARVAATAADVQRERATLAVIATERARAVAELQTAQATIQATQAASAAAAQRERATLAVIAAERARAIAELQTAQATIQATQSIGFLSGALAANAAASNAAAAAMARLASLSRLESALAANAAAANTASAAMAKLASLGQLETNVKASLTAATAAHTAATNANAAALSASATAQSAATAATAAAGAAAATTAARVGILTRVIGFLGGPIGAITTLLSLGVTAWAAWGQSAKEATETAKSGVAETFSIIEELDADIKKLEKRARLAATGERGRQIAQEDPRQAIRLAEIQDEINRIQKKPQGVVGEDVNRVRALAEEYTQIISRLERKKSLTEIVAGQDRGRALKGLLKEYATDAEQLAEALDEARKKLKLGPDEQLPAELERRIREKFTKKKNTSDAPERRLRQEQLQADIDDIKKAGDAEVSALERSQSILEARRAANLVEEKDYYQARAALIEGHGKAQEKALEEEIARRERERGTFTGKNAEAESVDNERQIQNARAELAKLRNEVATQIEINSIQEQAALKKVQQSYDDAREAANAYLETVRKRNEAELAGIGRGNKFREEQQAILDIQSRFDDRRRQLEGERRRKDITEEAFQIYLAEAKRTYDEEVRLYRERTDSINAAQQDWLNGATEALSNYYDEASNVAKNTEEVFSNAFKSLEDTLTEFLNTGRLDFKKFVTGILGDLNRQFIREQVTAPLSAALKDGGLLGNLGGLFGAPSIRAEQAPAPVEVRNALGTAPDVRQTVTFIDQLKGAFGGGDAAKTATAAADGASFTTAVTTAGAEFSATVSTAGAALTPEIAAAGAELGATVATAGASFATEVSAAGASFAASVSGASAASASGGGVGTAASVFGDLLNFDELATGGQVKGPGTETSDSVPTWLSKNEFVVRAAAVKQPGALKFLKALNERGIGAAMAATLISVPATAAATAQVRDVVVAHQFPAQERPERPALPSQHHRNLGGEPSAPAAATPLTAPTAEAAAPVVATVLQTVAAAPAAAPAAAAAPAPFIGSFATGISYVPTTGFALLHQGERVIPASQNDGSKSARPIQIVNQFPPGTDQALVDRAAVRTGISVQREMARGTSV